RYTVSEMVRHFAVATHSEYTRHDVFSPPCPGVGSPCLTRRSAAEQIRYCAFRRSWVCGEPIWLSRLRWMKFRCPIGEGTLRKDLAQSPMWNAPAPANRRFPSIGS